jgi:hypothetical protein
MSRDAESGSRQAASDAGSADECAVAFSLSGDIDTPEALAPDGGVAYLMQLSILGQQRTAELLDEQGFTARVVDFGLFEFTAHFVCSGSRSCMWRPSPVPTT